MFVIVIIVAPNAKRERFTTPHICLIGFGVKLWLHKTR